MHQGDEGGNDKGGAGQQGGRELVDEALAAAGRGDQEEALVAEQLPLQQLRRARALTQAQLAEVWGKNQVSISQIEKRTDLLISTLRRYVEAMGGRLSLVVEFEGGAPVHLTGLADDDLRPATEAEAR